MKFQHQWWQMTLKLTQGWECNLDKRKALGICQTSYIKVENPHHISRTQLHSTLVESHSNTLVSIKIYTFCPIELLYLILHFHLILLFILFLLLISLLLIHLISLFHLILLVQLILIFQLILLVHLILFFPIFLISSYIFIPSLCIILSYPVNIGKWKADVRWFTMMMMMMMTTGERAPVRMGHAPTDVNFLSSRAGFKSWHIQSWEQLTS